MAKPYSILRFWNNDAYALFQNSTASSHVIKEAHKDYEMLL